MFLFFAGLVGLTVFVLIGWAGTMVYRLYKPEQSRPFADSPVVQRKKATARGERISVGVREIRADRRRAERIQSDRWEYAWGRSDGIPESWHKDLWARRN